MPGGIPKTEEERKETHAEKYGGEPPTVRKGLGAFASNAKYYEIAVAFLLGLLIGMLI